jgi:hypothetical protein
MLMADDPDAADFCWDWDLVNADARDFVLTHLRHICTELELRRSRIRIRTSRLESADQRRKLAEETMTITFKLNALRSALRKLAAVPGNVPE